MRFQANPAALRALVRVALVLGVANWFDAGCALRAQEGASPPSDSRRGPPRYDVASIKPHKSFTRASGHGFSPNGVEYNGVTLDLLITSAYDVSDNQVSGMPEWVHANFYDIDAKVDADTAEAWKNLSINELYARQEPMLQSLLANRCKLKAHFDTREFPVYDLVVAKGGLKMKKSPPEEKPDGILADGHAIGRSTPLETLRENLSNWSGRIIVDKTGLGDQKFDFDLKWTPDDQRAADPADAGPSLFTALQEQLGLKLVASKGPVKILVIDHIERPSAN